MHVTHPVLGGLPSALTLRAHLVSHLVDTGAEQMKLAWQQTPSDADILGLPTLLS